MLIEDDETLRKHIAQYLCKYNFRIIPVVNFSNVEEEFLLLNPHLVLLDINLPVYDGYFLCRLFRRKSNIPIIIISARNSSAEQVMGIEFGADDYITKPIDLEILISKIKAALRRAYGEYAPNSSVNLTISGLTLNERNFKLLYKNYYTELSKNEYKLVKKLMLHKDQFVTREELLGELWDDIAFVDDNTLSVNIKRIKDKFEEFGVKDIIKTKRGIGYMLDSSSLEGNADEKVNL